MNFVSASPSIVRSVLQRSLLNTWQRLYDRCNGLPPFGQFAFDRLNVLYPALWFNGGGFATLVGTVDGDPMGQWRLYRINANPTPQ